MSNFLSKKPSGPVKKFIECMESLASKKKLMTDSSGKVQLQVVHHEKTTFLFSVYCENSNTIEVVNEIGRSLELEIRKGKAKVAVAPAEVSPIQ